MAHRQTRRITGSDPSRPSSEAVDVAQLLHHECSELLKLYVSSATSFFTRVTRCHSLISELKKKCVREWEKYRPRASGKLMDFLCACVRACVYGRGLEPPWKYYLNYDIFSSQFSVFWLFCQNVFYSHLWKKSEFWRKKVWIVTFIS